MFFNTQKRYQPQHSDITDLSEQENFDSSPSPSYNDTKSEYQHHQEEETVVVDYGSDEQVDYASEMSPYTVGAMLGEVKGQFGNSSVAFGAPGAELDYLFRDEEKLKGERGWNEKICYNTGIIYALGLSSGGAWGLYEGFKVPVGNSWKLRLNSILNGCTRRGPLVGNSAAVCTMFYTSFAHGFQKIRGEDDLINHVAAGALAGGLFKSTAGARAALKSAGLFGGLAAAVGLAYNAYTE